MVSQINLAIQNTRPPNEPESKLIVSPYLTLRSLDYSSSGHQAASLLIRTTL